MNRPFGVGLALIILAFSGRAAGAHPLPHERATTVAAESGADWNLYHGDPAGSGVAASPGHVDLSTRAWTSPALQGDIYGAPVVFGGQVFVSTEDDPFMLSRPPPGSWTGPRTWVHPSPRQRCRVETSHQLLASLERQSSIRAAASSSPSPTSSSMAAPPTYCSACPPATATSSSRKGSTHPVPIRPHCCSVRV